MSLLACAQRKMFMSKGRRFVFLKAFAVDSQFAFCLPLPRNAGKIAGYRYWYLGQICKMDKVRHSTLLLWILTCRCLYLTPWSFRTAHLRKVLYKCSARFHTCLCSNLLDQAWFKICLKLELVCLQEQSPTHSIAIPYRLN